MKELTELLSDRISWRTIGWVSTAYLALGFLFYLVMA